MAKEAKSKAKRQSSAYSTSACPHHFGYLRQRPRDQEIPEECLACEKMVDCMLSELRGDYLTGEIEKGEIEKAEAEPEIPTVEEVKELAEEPVENVVQKEDQIVQRQEIETAPLIAEPSKNHFIVEDLGMLYASWSGTVRIHKETLSEWGGRIKEVEVENLSGKRVRCKVVSMEESQKGVIQLPDKVQRNLGILKGDVVKVKPVTK
jgi:translation initiation factor IF-1